MKRPFKDKRLVGPVFTASTNVDTGLRVYHKTSEDNLESIKSDGIMGSISDEKTDEVEKAMELTRPEEYPSRLNAVFTHHDSGIAESTVDEGDVLLSFDASKAPCAGYGVRGGSNLMVLPDLVLEMGKAPSHPDVKATSSAIWEDDTEGPIRTGGDLKQANERFDVGTMQEIYFPCDIPSDIIRVET